VFDTSIFPFVTEPNVQELNHVQFSTRLCALLEGFQHHNFPIQVKVPSEASHHLLYEYTAILQQFLSYENVMFICNW
jgi:hypothetical protein